MLIRFVDFLEWVLYLIIDFILWIVGCEFGYYGDGCKLICGYCKLVSCDFEKGDCEDGCFVGWKGFFCKIGEWWGLWGWI